MMKSIMNILLVATLMLVSCGKQDSVPVSAGEVTVNYSVAFPATKAQDGDAGAVNYIWYAQYDHGSGELLKEYVPVTVVEGKAVCPVNMMRDHSYKLVFVAQHFDQNGEQKVPVYALDPRTALISMPVEAVANSDNYDVFVGLGEMIEYDGGDADPVELTRIVAQVNCKCTQASWDSFQPTSSSLMVEGVPQSYNALTNEFSEANVNVEYDQAPLDNGQPCLIGTAYCFARESVSKAELTLYNSSRSVVLKAESLPVDRNNKTNVLFTEDLNNL